MGTAHYSTFDGLALIRIDNPPVNALSSDVRSAVLSGLDRAAGDAGIRGVILAGSDRAFSSGADIRQFDTPQYFAYPRTGELADRIEAMDKPTIAAIAGFAMGGGLELALAAHHRVADAGATMALPEIHLGVIPAGGGILRLPRLVALPEAIALMMIGATISTAEALRFGLVDAIATDDLIAAAANRLSQVISAGEPIRRTLSLPVRGSHPGLFDEKRLELEERGCGEHAPRALLTCIEAAIVGPLDAARELIQATSAELVASADAKALRYVFFGKRAAAKSAALADVHPPRINSVVVLGAGGKADGLAARLRLAGREVYGAARCLDEAFGGCPDLVIDLRLREADGAGGLSTQAIIVSENPRTMAENPMIGFYAGGRDGAADLAEIVPAPAASPGAVAAIVKLAREIGLIPVLERDGPIGPRLWQRLSEAAAEMAAQGTPQERIDAALRAWGFKSGAFPIAEKGGVPALETPTMLRPTATGLEPQDIVERCVFVLANEGARLLEERAVEHASAIDVVLVYGYGFPARRGGPMHFAIGIGLDAALTTMRRLQAEGCAGFRTISPLIAQLASAGRPFT